MAYLKKKTKSTTLYDAAVKLSLKIEIDETCDTLVVYPRALAEKNSGSGQNKMKLILNFQAVFF